MTDEVVALLTVDLPSGDRLVERLYRLEDSDRENLRWVQDLATAEAERAGLTMQQWWAGLITHIAETRRDQQGYERVCERKGLLPL